MTSPFELRLENGNVIVSGWSDGDDPDALPAGDWLSVESQDGKQIFYEDSADLLSDPIRGRKRLYEFLMACGGKASG